MTVLDRTRNTYASSFPSEIVTCRLADGRERALFCKYGQGHVTSGHGHRGGAPYEAQVYRHVLAPLGFSVPALLGAHLDEASGETWEIFEYLEGALRIDEMEDPVGVTRAARWIGRFHAANESRATDPSLAFLNRYTTNYYAGWPRRTAEFAGPLRDRFPWLAEVCRRAEVAVARLAELPATVIHGEYTVHNVLARGQSVYPLDWESAAIAPGEVDLAALADFWPPDLVRGWEREYRQARWPGSASAGGDFGPADFERRLDTARLYWHFRWLGDRPEWTTRERAFPRFEAVRRIAERMGLV